MDAARPCKELKLYRYRSLDHGHRLQDPDKDDKAKLEAPFPSGSKGPDECSA